MNRKGCGMASRSRNSLKVDKKDSIEIAIDKNEKLINTIRRLEKEIKRLKSECKTLEKAWEKTEKLYRDVIKDITLEEALESVRTGKMLKLVNRCPSCDSISLKKIKCATFSISVCGSCDYRKKN